MSKKLKASNGFLCIYKIVNKIVENKKTLRSINLI